MKTLTRVILVLGICLASCQAEKEGQKKTRYGMGVLVAEFDTAQAIMEMNIREKLNRIALLATDSTTGTLGKLDTLNLTYHFAFCDCQRWVLSEVYEEALQQHPNLADLKPRINFNLKKYGFYIEPASPELDLEIACYNGNQIRIIGREYKELRLPTDVGFTSPDPPPGRVFRYYAYEIIRPFTVWGPEVIRDIDEISGDTLRGASQLLVK